MASLQQLLHWKSAPKSFVGVSRGPIPRVHKMLRVKKAEFDSLVAILGCYRKGNGGMTASIGFYFAAVDFHGIQLLNADLLASKNIAVSTAIEALQDWALQFSFRNGDCLDSRNYRGGNEISANESI
jgi:hypothetical protein